MICYTYDISGSAGGGGGAAPRAHRRLAELSSACVEGQRVGQSQPIGCARPAVGSRSCTANSLAAGTATLAELVCRPAAVFSRPAAVFSRPTALPCATYWLRLPNPVGSEGQLPVGPREP